MSKWIEAENEVKASEEYVEEIIKEKRNKGDDYPDYFLPYEMEDAFVAGVKYIMNRNKNMLKNFLFASGIELKED